MITPKFRAPARGRTSCWGCEVFSDFDACRPGEGQKPRAVARAIPQTGLRWFCRLAGSLIRIRGLNAGREINAKTERRKIRRELTRQSIRPSPAGTLPRGTRSHQLPSARINHAVVADKQSSTDRCFSRWQRRPVASGNSTAIPLRQKCGKVFERYSRVNFFAASSSRYAVHRCSFSRPSRCR